MRLCAPIAAVGSLAVFARLLSLLKQSAVYGLGSIAAKLAGILLLPLYLRYLEPRHYGAVEVVLAIDLLAAALVRLGMQNALMRFYYDDATADATADDATATTPSVVGQTAVLAMLASSTLGALALAAAAPWLAAAFLGDAQHAYLVQIGAFGVWASAMYQTLTATIRLEQRATLFLRFSLANIALTALCTITLLEIGWKAGGLLLGNFLGTALLIPAVALWQRRFVGLRFDRALARQMLAFGLPTMPIAIANQGLRMIDRFFLSRYAGLAPLGLFGVASRISQVVLLAVTALQLSWQPFAYSIKDDDEARRVYSAVMTYFVATIGWIALTVSLLAEPAVRLLTTPEFHTAWRTVPLLSIAAAVYGMYFVAGIGASRVKQTRYHALVAGGALAVSLAANATLVPRWNEMGAATAAVLANGALTLLMFVRSQHVFRVDYAWRRIATAGVLATSACAAAYVIPAEPWHLALRILLICAFPLLLLATGFFPPAERAAIATRIRVPRGRGR